MQNDVARKIDAIISRRELLSESEVSHLMTLCRKYLDHMSKEERSAYLVLRLFCNWAALTQNPKTLPFETGVILG